MKTPILTFDGCGLNFAENEYKDRFATLPTAHRDDYKETGLAVAALSRACHGLDLPADVPPGILAEIVTAARELRDAQATEEHARPAETQACHH
jgi:hypothetical protein